MKKLVFLAVIIGMMVSAVGCKAPEITPLKMRYTQTELVSSVKSVFFLHETFVSVERAIISVDTVALQELNLIKEDRLVMTIFEVAARHQKPRKGVLTIEENGDVFEFYLDQKRFEWSSDSRKGLVKIQF